MYQKIIKSINAKCQVMSAATASGYNSSAYKWVRVWVWEGYVGCGGVAITLSGGNTIQ